MANQAFHLQMISPERIVVDDYVRMVEIPGAEGDFGVLPDHSAFFSMIRPGTITIHMADGTRRYFTATSGYADVSATATTILSDSIVEA